VLYITTKLKRLIIIRIIVTLLLLPIRLPLIAFYKLGELSELIDDKIQGLYFKIEEQIIKKFNFDGIAKEQYGRNPTKFK